MNAQARPKTDVRASGTTAATDVADEVAEGFEEPAATDLPEERQRIFSTPGFSRMRLDWKGDDKIIVQRAQNAVHARILENFADAYQVMYQVYDLVRTPSVTPDGEIVKDIWGFTEWQRSPDGGYKEDWGKLTRGEKESLLFSITTRVFGWRERSDDAWGEAMFAKAQWLERFAIEYDKPMRGTIDDRTAKGNAAAAEERYFAIFLSLYSRRAESVVRSMELLGQRLKDSME